MADDPLKERFLPAPASIMDPLQLSFSDVRGTTEALCAPLEIDDYGAQSMPDASPAKWHLAHTSWFFEEFVLGNASPVYRFYDPRFRYLFNSYYEAVGPRHERPRRGLVTRPTVGGVLAYRKHVNERMTELLGQGTLPCELQRTITLGLHHEQQHQELLLTDIKHLFSCNPLLPVYLETPPAAPVDAVPLKFLQCAGGLCEIGHTGDGFCFDNEMPRHRAFIEPFRLANRPVSNGEFRDFIRAGGYTQAAHWLADGWACVQREDWRQPLYWSDSLEQAFTLAGLRELDLNAPVSHVSYYEADAFARWAGMRLPTEFEWEAAAAQFRYGEVWEWTSSAYVPYPGFAPLSGALGEYNAKFMVNQLVLRGGSSATPPGHIRASYRNFFYPAARWQVSGLRLASASS
jgi:ergothioneine biosynthesis protein EgtB